jgi:hypothetical protein
MNCMRVVYVFENLESFREAVRGPTPLIASNEGKKHDDQWGLGLYSYLVYVHIPAFNKTIAVILFNFYVYNFSVYLYYKF